MKTPFWHPRHATGRLLIAVVVALATFALFQTSAPYALRGLLAWDAGALTFLALAVRVLRGCNAAETRTRAGSEDPGRRMVWLLTISASLVSLFGAIAVLRHARTLSGTLNTFWTSLALLAVALSWLLTHTLYALRYARLYYAHKSPGGLQFPGDRPPADLDFAYFAFTIGMCFQVSDVVIASSHMRHTALGHALLSFVYNTMILSIGMNLVFAQVSSG